MTPLENIFIIRHGESEEDVNPEIKWEKDNKDVRLTENGIRQAKEAAQSIKKELEGFEKITIYTSPFQRTRETAEIIKQEISEKDIGIVVEESLRGLNWGNVTLDNARQLEQERYKVGVLHFHFPKGDQSPVYVKNIYDFVYEIIKRKHLGSDKKECIIIIGHGFSIRIVVKAFIKMTDEDFKWIKNPPNSFITRIYFDPEKNDFYIKEPLPTVK